MLSNMLSHRFEDYGKNQCRLRGKCKRKNYLNDDLESSPDDCARNGVKGNYMPWLHKLVQWMIEWVIRTQWTDNLAVIPQSAHNSTEYSPYGSTERPSSRFILKKFVDDLWCNVVTGSTTKLKEFESLLVLG